MCFNIFPCFLQSWYDNMGRAGDANIKYFDGDDYTCITFRPDLPKFKMTVLDKDTVALMTRRAYDIAGSTKGVHVFFNGKRLPVSSSALCFFSFSPCCQLILVYIYWVLITVLVLQVTGFRSYVDMYLKDKVSELGSPLTVIHDVVNERWEVCLTMSEKGFQQVSFVNSIATTKVTIQ